MVETYPFPSSLALVPVKLLEKGWSGVHHISDVKPLPLSPNEFTNEGKSNALPIVTTFGLKPC